LFVCLLMCVVLSNLLFKIPLVQVQVRHERGGYSMNYLIVAATNLKGMRVIALLHQCYFYETPNRTPQKSHVIPILSL